MRIMSDEISPKPVAAGAPPRRHAWWRFLPGLGGRNRGDHLADAQRFVEHHNLGQALRAYQQALDADPRSARAHQGLALLLARKGGREPMQAALGHILEAVQIDPYDPQNYRINALIYHRLGKLKRAAVELRCMAITHTLKRQPDHPVAHNQMGVVLLRQFRADLAMEHFQRAVRAQPRYELALRNLARTCCARAEAAQDAQVRAALLNAAGGHVQRALEAAPSAAGWVILARIRLTAGLVQEALAAIEEAQRFATPVRELASTRAEVELALACQPQAAAAAASNSHPVAVG